MSTTCSGERQPLKRTATESTHRRNDDQAIEKKTGYGIIYLSVAMLFVVVVVVVALKSFLFSVDAVSGDTTSLMLRTSEVGTTSTSNVEVEEVEGSISLDSNSDTALMNNNNNANNDADLSNLVVPSNVGSYCRQGSSYSSPKKCFGGTFCNFDHNKVSGVCESCPIAEIICYHLGLPNHNGQWYNYGEDACVRKCDFTVENCDDNTMCSNNGFCNFDFGSAGFCQPCPIAEGVCFKQGLPEYGALACQMKCVFITKAPSKTKPPLMGNCDANTRCSNNGFCDFDFGYTGFCQPCPIAEGVCFEQGLPRKGATACAEKCEFYMTPDYTYAHKK